MDETTHSHESDSYATRFPKHEESTAARSEPLRGDLPHIPSYELLDEIGRGGMGVVYKARQVGLNRVVALKMILAGDFATGDSRQRFLKEAEVVAQLRHPHIVQVHDCASHNGQPFFAMEFVEGGTLAHKLQGNPLPPRQAAELVEKLANAVAAVHAQGIIHRDLKPGNVLLTADGEPKITDFGLARHVSSDLTASGAVIGTPSYMAPEQAAGKLKELGPATDVYALGAILYELLTGRPPLKGATPAETLQQVLHDEPVTVRQLQPKTPRDLETICHKCLQKSAGRRYATAQELGEDLRLFVNAEPIHARPVSRAERAWRWCQRRPASAALMLALALVIVGSIAALAGLYFQAERLRELADERAHTIARARFTERQSQYEQLSQLAEFLREQGKLGEAEALYREQLRLERSQAEYAEDLPVGLMMSLVAVLYQQGKLDEAEGLLREILAVERRNPEMYGGRITLAMTQNWLSMCLTDTGRAAEAEPLLRESLAVFQETATGRLGPIQQVPLAETESVLGGCLVAQGKYAEAEPMLLRSYAVLEAFYAREPYRGVPAASRVPRALKRLISLYEALGKPDEAAIWRAKLSPDPALAPSAPSQNTSTKPR